MVNVHYSRSIIHIAQTRFQIDQETYTIVCMGKLTMNNTIMDPRGTNHCHEHKDEPQRQQTTPNPRPKVSRHVQREKLKKRQSLSI